MIISLEAWGTNAYNHSAMCPTGHFRITEGFDRIFEPSHCIPDINSDGLLGVPVVNKDILDNLNFILNLAVTTDV